MTTVAQLCQHLVANGGAATTKKMLANFSAKKRTLYDLIHRARAAGFVQPVPQPHTNARLFELTPLGREFGVSGRAELHAPVHRDTAPRFAWRHGRVASVFELGRCSG